MKSGRTTQVMGSSPCQTPWAKGFTESFSAAGLRVKSTFMINYPCVY